MGQFSSRLTTVVAAVLLSTGIAAAEKPKRTGTLVMSAPQTPRHLNPAVQSGTATGTPGAQLVAAPLRYDENWEPQPYLAKSWDISEDGLAVTLDLTTLYPGVA